MSNLDLPPANGEGTPGTPCLSRRAAEETATATAVELPAVGDLAYDGRLDRVGRVMALGRTYAVLRPSGGGLEWEVPLGHLHQAERAEELRSRVAELNASSRWGL